MRFSLCGYLVVGMSRATEFFVVFAKSSTVSCTWSARSTELMKLGGKDYCRVAPMGIADV